MEKKVEQVKELTDLIDEWYVPSALERKRALFMYLLVWIFAMFGKDEITKYEMFHFKQSIWWWVLFLPFILLSILFLMIPFVRIIFVIILLLMLWIFVFFIKQSWDWDYVYWKDKKIVVPLFSYLWWWVVDIFELDMKIKDE